MLRRALNTIRSTTFFSFLRMVQSWIFSKLWTRSLELPVFLSLSLLSELVKLISHPWRNLMPMMHHFNHLKMLLPSVMSSNSLNSTNTMGIRLNSLKRSLKKFQDKWLTIFIKEKSHLTHLTQKFEQLSLLKLDYSSLITTSLRKDKFL